MKIEKHPDRIILRQSPFPAVAGGIALGMGFGLAAVLILLAPSLMADGEIPILIFAAVFTAIIIGLGISRFIPHLGRRMVLDGEGVHVRSSLMRETFLPWRKVRDLGVTHEDGGPRRRYQRAHYFYISPTRLGTDGSIRVIRKHNSALTLAVSRGEIDGLYGQGVMDFCEKHVNEGREEWDRVIPYSSLEINRHDN